MALYQNIKCVDANKFHLSAHTYHNNRSSEEEKNTITRVKNRTAFCTDEYPQTVSTQESILQSVLDCKAAGGKC